MFHPPVSLPFQSGTIVFGGKLLYENRERSGYRVHDYCLSRLICVVKRVNAIAESAVSVRPSQNRCVLENVIVRCRVNGI